MFLELVSPVTIFLVTVFYLRSGFFELIKVQLEEATPEDREQRQHHSQKSQ